HGAGASRERARGGCLLRVDSVQHHRCAGRRRTGAARHRRRPGAGNGPPRPFSGHLAESREEVEFIRSGTGPWRTLLEELGSWDASWAAPGGTPVEFLDGCGFLDSRLLAVHGVQMTRGDLARLAERGVTLVTCPRSNAHTGAGEPPVADFYASGVRVAIGTDSLASTPDLNVFSELR